LPPASLRLPQSPLHRADQPRSGDLLPLPVFAGESPPKYYMSPTRAITVDNYGQLMPKPRNTQDEASRKITTKPTHEPRGTRVSTVPNTLIAPTHTGLRGRYRQSYADSAIFNFFFYHILLDHDLKGSACRVNHAVCLGRGRAVYHRGITNPLPCRRSN
jgi:hypothetical protein